MDRNLALEFVRATEDAALEAAKWLGRGDAKAADQSAVDAMRKRLNSVAFRGRVTIGEGERDEAPMLFIGEKLGSGEGPELDVAVDPLEGTRLVENGWNNAITVLAAAGRGSVLHVPDTYMDKLAVGPGAARAVRYGEPARDTIHAVADALGKPVSEVTVVAMDRPRHAELVKEVRATGARLHLIPEGDVSGAVATARPESPVDVLLGIGAAPEGVISAAALKCLGGNFFGQLRFRNDAERKRAADMGFTDPDKVLGLEDLMRGPCLFVATGVSDGDLLRGVRYASDGARTHSVVMRSKSGTVRWIDATHRQEQKTK